VSRLSTVMVGIWVSVRIRVSLILAIGAIARTSRHGVSGVIMSGSRRVATAFGEFGERTRLHLV